MVRFKNRYLLFELVWKDGKLDDSISEQGKGAARLRAMAYRRCQPAGKRGRQQCCLPSQMAAGHHACAGRRPTAAPPGAHLCADEAVLLAVFRDSLQQNFGDHGLGCALASLQGGCTIARLV